MWLLSEQGFGILVKDATVRLWTMGLELKTFQLGSNPGNLSWSRLVWIIFAYITNMSQPVKKTCYLDQWTLVSAQHPLKQINEGHSSHGNNGESSQ